MFQHIPCRIVADDVEEVDSFCFFYHIIFMMIYLRSVWNIF